jgi:glycosyltransferase involved in cell wall biosynthesis
MNLKWRFKNKVLYDFFLNRLRQAPYLVYEFKADSNHDIVVTFVIPIHNQAEIIRDNLQALLQFVSEDCEIILIDDASTDKTKNEVLTTIKRQLPEVVKSVKFFQFKYPIYESACDDFGIRNANGKYIIEIQADMKLVEHGFDSKMLHILIQNPDVFMLSGRGVMRFCEISQVYEKSSGTEGVMSRSLVASAVNNLKLFINDRVKESQVEYVESQEKIRPEFFAEVVFPSYGEYKNSGRAGRLGRLIEFQPDKPNHDIYIGETVMRGPICFERQRYIELNGFNLSSFFLGYDEHDLNLRARLRKNWKAAFVYVGFQSPLSHGSMRKKRSIRDKYEMYLANKRINRSPENELSNFKYHESKLLKEFEIRKGQV